MQPQFDIKEEVSGDEVWKFKFGDIIYRDESSVHQNSDKSIQKSTPMMCRMRDLTYEVNLKCDLHYSRYKVHNNGREEMISANKINRVMIASMPIMLFSDWCNFRNNQHTKEETVKLGECPE